MSNRTDSKTGNMRRVHRWLLIVAFLASLRPAIGVQDRSMEHRLLRALFANYNSIVRPVTNSEKAVIVQLTYYLYSLSDVNERSESVTLNGYLHMVWVDEFLTWKREDYGNISSVSIPSNEMWTPAILIENALDDQFYRTSYFPIRLHHTGEVRWDVGGPMTLLCDFTVRHYPFDRQKCAMKFVTWSGTDDHVKIYGRVFDAETFYREDGNWHIYGTQTLNLSLHEQDETFCEVHFLFQLERKTLTGVLNVVLPIILLSVLNGAVFILPHECGEKISLSLTLLLSFTVLQFSLDSDIPSNSESSPLLDIYIIVFIICSCVTVIETVVSLRLFYRTDPVTAEAKAFLRVYYALTSHTRPTPTASKSNRIHQAPAFKNQRADLVLAEGNHDEVPRYEWRDVSIAIDNVWCIFFLIFFCATTITIVVLLIFT